MLFEEFGYARSNRDHIDVYRMWLDTVRKNPDCAGWLVWRLVSKQESGRYPVDTHDQFDIRNDKGPLWKVLKTAAEEMRSRGRNDGAAASGALPAQ
jgi:mannan endo-1,4-beta-mannosidase